MTHIISPQRNDVEHLLRSEDIIGSKILAENGREAGRVIGFYINEDSMKGLHVLYDDESYFIDLQYVKRYDEEAVMLSMQPYYLLQGLAVYDEEGRYLGSVREATRKPNTNKVEELLVKKYFFSTPTTIPASHIKTAHDSIILSEAYANS